MEKTNDKRTVPSDVDLYRKAEKLLETRDPDSVFANGEIEAVRLIHELYVHQIELELQNEELRKTQEKLDRVKEHYLDLYDLAPVGYCTISEKGLILEANLTSTIKLGVTRESIIHKPLNHYVFTEDQDIYYFFFRKLTSNTTEPQTCELRMVKSDNTPFWVSLRAIEAFGSEGNPSYLLTITDITERKLAEEELSFNLSLFQSTVEATADGILVVDCNGKISAYNRLFAKMWQIPDDILAGKDDKAVLDFIIDQLTNPAEFLQLVNDLYDQPDAERFDTIEFKDGRVFERYTRPQIVGNSSFGLGISVHGKLNNSLK